MELIFGNVFRLLAHCHYFPVHEVSSKDLALGWGNTRKIEVFFINARADRLEWLDVEVHSNYGAHIINFVAFCQITLKTHFKCLIMLKN